MLVATLQRRVSFEKRERRGGSGGGEGKYRKMKNASFLAATHCNTLQLTASRCNTLQKRV